MLWAAALLKSRKKLNEIILLIVHVFAQRTISNVAQQAGTGS